MALQINSPADVVVTEGQAVNVGWVASGGGGANYSGSITKNGSPYSSETNTTGLFSVDIPTAQPSDAGTYEITVTNAGSSVSDSVAVTVNSAIAKFTMTQGATEIECDPLYGYESVLRMSMMRGIDSRGRVAWLDNGRQYDQYETTFKIRTIGDNSEKFEDMVAGDSVDTVVLNAPWQKGFRPFGYEFSTGDYPVNIASVESVGDVDIFGKQREYTIKIYPAVSHTTFTQSGAISSCVPLNHWQIGDMYLPFAEWVQEINDFRRVIKTGSTSSQVVDPARSYGDVVKLKFTV
jgi:hypothetical protein